MALNAIVFPSGDLAANGALLWCGKTREAVVVDPGGEPDEILALASDRGLAIVGILLTHAHIDNAGAVPEIKDETSADIHLHHADLFLWDAMEAQCSELGFEPRRMPPVDEFIEEGGIVRIGKERLEIWHLPGHSPGSCGFRADDFILCGDTCSSKGASRTDLWGGSADDLVLSLDRLAALPPETRIIPGHGTEFSPARIAKLRGLVATDI